MERYTIHTDTPHQRIIRLAADALSNGEIVIYPTDTIYGIGCSIQKKKVIEKLYRLKGKSKFDHMSMICDSIQQAAEYVKIPTSTFRILKKCFPGPFTVILEPRRQTSKLMLTRQKEIGLRIPDAPVCRMIVEMLGEPIMNTSYDPSNNGYFDNVYQSMDEYNPYTESAAMLLDAGPLDDAGLSTVVRIIDDDIEILRQGKGDVDLLYR